jgi:hypothetical protein
LIDSNFGPILCPINQIHPIGILDYIIHWKFLLFHVVFRDYSATGYIFILVSMFSRMVIFIPFHKAIVASKIAYLFFLIYFDKFWFDLYHGFKMVF